MRKIIVFLLMCMIVTAGLAAGKKRGVEKAYKGQYIKSTNTFTYKKDNLIFPDKWFTYELQDNSGLLAGIYDFMSRTYGITDEDIIELDVVGRVSGSTLVVTKVTNYRMPEEKFGGTSLGSTGEETNLEIQNPVPATE